MANKNINGTNLVIGPNTRVEAGEIKKLEIFHYQAMLQLKQIKQLLLQMQVLLL